MSDSMSHSESEAKSPSESIYIDNEWMIRPCEMYKEEYSDCTSIKGRFHQYFIFGETLDCVQWKKDFDNCLKWKEDADAKAASLWPEAPEASEKPEAHFPSCSGATDCDHISTGSSAFINCHIAVKEKQIIYSEKNRRRERLGAHYANNTWEKRNSAPEDWNKPLPEYISLDYERSYLGIKAKQLLEDGNVTPQSLKNRNLCIVM